MRTGITRRNFQDDRPFGTDSAEADGFAGCRFNTHSNDGGFEMRFGPERYAIPEAVVSGN